MSKKYSAQLPRDARGREIVKDALAGYRRMNKFSESELRHDLPKMTEDESREQFEELSLVWQHSRSLYPSTTDDAILDQMHIEELAKGRRLWDKIAQRLAEKKAHASDF